MAIEVWKFGLTGPRRTASYLWLKIKEGQPHAKFAKWSWDTIAVDTRLAAELLGGTEKICKYSGLIAGSRKLNQEYHFDVGYSALIRGDVTRVYCRLCGYTSLEGGRFQIEPHPRRLYVATPQKKWAKLYDANFSGDIEVGGLVSPTRPTRLIFCRFDTGMVLHLPSWVERCFPYAQLRLHSYSHAILEARPL